MSLCHLAIVLVKFKRKILWKLHKNRNFFLVFIDIFFEIHYDKEQKIIFALNYFWGIGGIIFMKKHYEALEMSVVLFDNEDIVTTSSVTDLFTGDKNDNDVAWDILNK